MKVTKNTKRIKSPKRKSKSTVRGPIDKLVNTTSAIDTSTQEIINKDIQETEFWENEVKNEKELRALEVLCGLSDEESQNLSLEYKPGMDFICDEKKTTPNINREADTFTDRMLLVNAKIRRKKPDARDEKKPKTIMVHVRHQRNFVQENMAIRLKKEVSKEKTPIANNNASVRDIKESIDRVIETYNGKEKNDGLLPTKHFVHEKLNENGKLSYEEKSIGMNNTYQPSIKKNDDTPGKQKLLKNIPLSFAQAASKRVKLRPKSLEKGHDKEVVSRSQLSRQMALELIEKFEKANKEKQSQLEDVSKTGINRRPESRARNIVELTLQKTESLNTYLDIKDKKPDHIVKEFDWNRPQSNSSYRNREKEPTTPGVVRVEEFWGGESPLRSIRKANVHRKRSSEKLEKTPLNIKSSFELPKNSKEGYEGLSYDPKGIKIKAQSIMEKSMQYMQDRTITKITIGSPQQRNLRKFLNQVNSHREFIKGEKISISSIPLQKTVLDNPDKKQNPNGPSIDSDRRLKLPDTLKAFSGKTNSRDTTKYIRSLTYRGNPSAAGTETPLMTRNYKEFTVAALHKIPKTQFMEAVGRKY